MDLRRRRLGASDLSISALGIGTWAIGGAGWSDGWGPQDDRASAATIERALDEGINWIDTAPVYGLGHAERIVARALAGRRGAAHVFTKCGFVWDDRGRITRDLQRETIRRECEDSLRRLRVDAIDLYQIHRLAPDEDIAGPWRAMAELQREGKVRWIGASNVTAAQLASAQAIAPVTAVQPPYSIVMREADPAIERELLPAAARAGVGVIVYSPMQCGLLSGAMTRERIAALPEDDQRKRREEFRDPVLARVLELGAVLREIGAAHRATAGEIAVAWCLRRPEVTGAIVGLRRPEQVAGIIGAATLTLADEECRAIDATSILQPA
jgi:aryl-alcohol dehydrogenase-like predicted oxidoreductase